MSRPSPVQMLRALFVADAVFDSLGAAERRAHFSVDGTLIEARARRRELRSEAWTSVGEGSGSGFVDAMRSIGTDPHVPEHELHTIVVMP